MTAATPMPIPLSTRDTVSYTHLDVYKRQYVESLTYAAPSLDDWVGKDVDRAMKGPEAYVEIDTPWHFIEIATWGPDCARVWVWNRIGSHGVSQN